MKYIKTFEGHGRIEFSEDGKQAIVGPVGLAQCWDWEIDQKPGFDPESLILPPDNCYNYLWDADDHIDQKDVDKMMSPHMKNDNSFGFNPMNELNYFASPKNNEDEDAYFIKKDIESIEYILKDEGISIKYIERKLKLRGHLFSFILKFHDKYIVDRNAFSIKYADVTGEFFDRLNSMCESRGCKVTKTSDTFDYVIKKSKEK